MLNRYHAGRIGLVLGLLLIHFWIRTYQITVQDPYIDESYHIIRASTIWNFDTHPGHVAHGKVLLYFWLGLFKSDPHLSLRLARTSIALFSMITAASIYQIGKKLRDHRTGLLALVLYSVFPLTVFYERMALADPFALGFVCLAAWRSLIVVSRPTVKEGFVLGCMIALATLAKLTMVLIPLLPVAAILFYYPWRRVSDLKTITRTYSTPLLVAASMVIVAWLPLVIPAYRVRHTDTPFVLINPTNVQTPRQDSALLGYLNEIFQLMVDFTGEFWLLLVVIALVTWLILEWRRSASILFLITWLALSSLLVLTMSTLASARYFMPLAAPLVLLVAYVITGFLRTHRTRRVIGWAAMVGLGVWSGMFALPFVHDSLYDPQALHFHGINYNEYQSGWITGDDAIRAVAEYLDMLEHAPSRVYASYTLCELLYFYSSYPITCFDEYPSGPDVLNAISADFSPDEVIYFLTFDEDNQLIELDELQGELLGFFDRKRTHRPIWMWQVWYNQPTEVY